MVTDPLFLSNNVICITHIHTILHTKCLCNLKNVLFFFHLELFNNIFNFLEILCKTWGLQNLKK